MNIDAIYLTAQECHALALARHPCAIYDVEVGAHLNAIQERYPELITLSGVDFARTRTCAGPLPFLYAEVTPAGLRVLRQFKARDSLPPCLGEAFRDTLHDIYRAGYRVDQ